MLTQAGHAHGSPAILPFRGVRCLVLALMWMVGCTQAPDSALLATSPAPIPAIVPVAPAPSAATVPEGLADITRRFPHGEVSEVAGPESLRTHLSGLLEALGPQAPGKELQVAFVVDRSLPENAASALELALAGNRAKLARGGRFALVSYGNDAGKWSARVEAPLSAAPYAVVRAAGRVEWTPDGSGAAGSYAGLQEAMRLDWLAGSGRPLIVLLTDDRSRPDILRAAPLPPPADPKAWAAVGAWARTTDATLHAVRCRLELADGLGTDADAHARSGLSLDVVAGLFPEGHYTRADSPAALAAALEDALARAAPPDAPAEAALVVDRGGLMGAALGSLVKASPALERFVTTPGHRLALIQWGTGAPAVTVRLTSHKGRMAKALAALRPGPPGDEPRNLFAALQAARSLEWTPAARKSVIVLTAAPSTSAATRRDVLEWAGQAGVAITLIAPAPGATAPGPAR